jgi:hypothetical protein
MDETLIAASRNAQTQCVLSSGAARHIGKGLTTVIADSEAGLLLLDRPDGRKRRAEGMDR